MSRRGYPWEGVSFCRTKEALACLAGPHPVLLALPDRYQEFGETAAGGRRNEFEPASA